MKKNGVYVGISITCITLLVLLLSGLFFASGAKGNLSPSTFLRPQDRTASANADQELSFSSVNALALGVENAKITIYPSQDENARVLVTDLPGVLVTVEDGVLHIKKDAFYRDSLLQFALQGNIVVYLPQGLSEISARTTSGAILLEGLSCDRLSLRTSSGEIQANALQCADATMVASSGKIKINDVTASSMALHTSSGSIHAKAMASDRLKANASSGNVSLALVAPSEMDVATSSGRIDVSCPVPCHGTINATSGSVSLDLPTDQTFRATITTGSIVIDGKRVASKHLAGGGRGILIEGASKEMAVSVTSGRISLR